MTHKQLPSNGKPGFSSLCRELPLITMAVLFLFASMTINGITQEQDQSDQLKVGVVDIREVYRSYERASNFSKTFQKKKKKAETKIKNINSKLKQIKQELNELEPLSDIWKKRAQKYYELQSKQKLLKDLWKKDTKKLLSETSAKIYEEIRKTVEEYGKKHNYDLILKADQQKLTGQGLKDVNEKISTRSVLHFRNEMDLTDKIITIMNEQYEPPADDEGSSSEENGSSTSEQDE